MERLREGEPAQAASAAAARAEMTVRFVRLMTMVKSILLTTGAGRTTTCVLALSMSFSFDPCPSIQKVEGRHGMVKTGISL